MSQEMFDTAHPIDRACLQLLNYVGNNCNDGRKLSSYETAFGKIRDEADKTKALRLLKDLLSRIEDETEIDKYQIGSRLSAHGLIDVDKKDLGSDALISTEPVN